jgi:hypothetical protein
MGNIIMTSEQEIIATKLFNSRIDNEKFIIQRTKLGHLPRKFTATHLSILHSEYYQIIFDRSNNTSSYIRDEYKMRKHCRKA